MRKNGTFLFSLFLVIALVFLVAINFFKESFFLALFLNDFTILAVSVILIIVIVILFVFREMKNIRIQNEFITIVTHKFRTPLTGIRWTIDMLQKDLTLLEKKDLLVEMQKANERLMEIVDLMVGFAKFDKRLQYAFEAVSLREIITASINKYSAMIRNKEIVLSLDSGKELPMVIIDRAKIQFVVDMLIDNAIKYTHKGGSVSVAFDMDERSITL